MFNKILFATTASPTCDNAAKVAFDMEMKWEAKLDLDDMCRDMWCFQQKNPNGFSDCLQT